MVLHAVVSSVWSRVGLFPLSAKLGQFSRTDDAILKYAFPSKFDLGIDSRGNRFDGLSRQWLRPFAQIVGSTPNFILFFLEAGKLQNWESPLSGGSGQIGKLGKPASRRKRADWKAGKARFPEKAGNVGNWERPLLGGSGQIGILGKPASRRKRANWEIGKARFPEEAGRLEMCEAGRLKSLEIYCGSLPGRSVLRIWQNLFSGAAALCLLPASAPSSYLRKPLGSCPPRGGIFH